MPAQHIILDIDRTLANMLSLDSFDKDKDSIETLLDKYPFLRWFNDKKLLFYASCPHIFHPGIFEFLKYILSIPDVKVSFFSAGESDRNIPLATELLLRAFTLEELRNSKQEFLIFSREHLTFDKRFSQNQFYALTRELGKKDLSALKLEEELENIILIDDKLNATLPEQRENIVLIQDARPLHFLKVHEETLISDDAEGVEDELRRTNHLFYIVGLLKRTLASNFKSLSKKSYHFQHEKQEDGRYEFKDELYYDLALYTEGLEELRKFNPTLEFYGGEMAKKYFDLSIDEDEEVKATASSVSLSN